MKYDRNKHHRRSIRLKGYDYAQPGAYFITICTYQRIILFGEIVDGEMVLNACGDIFQNAWDDLPNHYPHVVLDELCIMPNHIHGIIILDDSHPCRGGSETRPYAQSTRPHDPTHLNDPTHPHDPTRPYDATRPHNPIVPHDQPTRSIIKRHALPEIVRALKSFSSRRINQILTSTGAPVWQRNYYEHIVRNEAELAAIRQYIQNNPLKWELDPDNPFNLAPDNEVSKEVANGEKYNSTRNKGSS